MTIRWQNQFTINLIQIPCTPIFSIYCQAPLLPFTFFSHPACNFWKLMLILVVLLSESINFEHQYLFWFINGTILKIDAPFEAVLQQKFFWKSIILSHLVHFDAVIESIPFLIQQLGWCVQMPTKYENQYWPWRIPKKFSANI